MSTIKIKKSHKGLLTEQAKSAGYKSPSAFAHHVLANKEDFKPATVKRAVFAVNFGGKKKAQAGQLTDQDMWGESSMMDPHYPNSYDYKKGTVTDASGNVNYLTPRGNEYPNPIQITPTGPQIKKTGNFGQYVDYANGALSLAEGAANVIGNNRLKNEERLKLLGNERYDTNSDQYGNDVPIFTQYGGSGNVNSKNIPFLRKGIRQNKPYGQVSIYQTGGEPSSSKAKEILRDGTAQGHKLTPKQKKFFGWIAGGKKQAGGDPRLVTTVPQGYTFLKKDGTKKYYNANASNTLPMATGSGPGDPNYEKFLQQQLQSGITPQELVQKKYISPDEVPKYQSYYQPVKDTVYTDESGVPIPDPAEAFEGQGIMDTNKHLVGLIKYPTRNSNAASKSGNMDGSVQKATFMYTLPNSSKPDFSKGKFQIDVPAAQKLFGTTNQFQSPDIDLSKYKMQAGGVPTTQGLPDDMDFMGNVEAEEGEVFQQNDGNISKVADNAGTHGEGGVMLPNVNRVLEDTSDKRKDKASKLLKLKPDTVKAMFGFKPKGDLSHSKAFEKATEFFNKQKDKINKANIDINDMSFIDKNSSNSAKLNFTSMKEMPTSEDLFNPLFSHQEQVKAENNIGDDGKMMKGGQIKIKRKYQTGGSFRNPVFVQGNVNADGTPSAGQGDSYGTPFQDNSQQDLNTDVTINPDFANPVPNNFNEPTHWYDVAPSVYSLVDSMRRTPELFNSTNISKVRFKRLNPAPALEANQDDYNAALHEDAMMSPESGAGAANIANLTALKYKANNQVTGQYANENTQISNSEEQYNANADDRQSMADAATRGSYYEHVLASREAQREQFLTSLQALSKIQALKRRQNVSGNLLLKLTPAFNQEGEYNGYKNKFYLPASMNTGTSVPGYNGAGRKPLLTGKKQVSYVDQFGHKQTITDYSHQ